MKQTDNRECLFDPLTLPSPGDSRASLVPCKLLLATPSLRARFAPHLVVTTDLGPGGEFLLKYGDATTDPVTFQPLAGELSVSVCVDQDPVDSLTRTGPTCTLISLLSSLRDGSNHFAGEIAG